MHPTTQFPGKGAFELVAIGKELVYIIDGKHSWKTTRDLVVGDVEHTSPGRGISLSENSRRLWLFPGSVRGGSRGKLRESPRKTAGIIFPNREKLQILGSRAPQKGKPAENLGSTLPGRCPHLLRGVFFEIDSSGLLGFFLSLGAEK